MQRCATAQGFKVPVFNQQFVLVLFEEEANACHGKGGPEAQRIFDDEVEIEKLNAFDRAPDLFSASAETGNVEHVDQRSFVAGHPHAEPLPPFFA
ncbi:MAG: hypothetical protein SGI86_07240 [Deltaproteobacteria bacterium]|nr:hypothetical protein [Deltaproteobacteria bacterium]